MNPSGRDLAVWLLLLLALSPAMTAASSASREIQSHINQSDMCFSLAFTHLDVDAEKGILNAKRGGIHEVRIGERLAATDVDLRENGFEVQIEFESPSTRGESVDVYIFTRKDVRDRGEDRELVNLVEVTEGLRFFARPCGQPQPARPSTPPGETIEPDKLLADILELMERKFDTDVLVAFVGQKSLSRSLGTDDLEEWKAAGVPDEVLEMAMKRAGP